MLSQREAAWLRDRVAAAAAAVQVDADWWDSDADAVTRAIYRVIAGGRARSAIDWPIMIDGGSSVGGRDDCRPANNRVAVCRMIADRIMIDRLTPRWAAVDGRIVGRTRVGMEPSRVG